MFPIKQTVTSYTVDFVVAALPAWRAVFSSANGETVFREVAAWAVIAAEPPDTGHAVVPLVVGGHGLTVATAYGDYAGLAPPGSGNNWVALPDLAPAPA